MGPKQVMGAKNMSLQKYLGLTPSGDGRVKKSLVSQKFLLKNILERKYLLEILGSTFQGSRVNTGGGVGE